MNKIEKAAYDKVYRQENKERFAPSKRRWGQSPHGKAHMKAYHATWYAKNGERNRAQHRQYLRTLREEVIAAYGGRCICCGEKAYEFLTFDHINGGGAEHKRQGLVGGKRLVWLRDDHPTDIQVLCYNCNNAKGVYGECPHRLKRLIDG